MDIAQLNVFNSLLTRQKPYVVQALTATVNAATITVPIPRGGRGMLCEVVIFNVGGSAAPGTLTGFTSGSTRNADSVNTQPGYRAMYKHLVGNEALTINSTATGATAMTAHVFLIAGTRVGNNPVSNHTAATATNTANASAITVSPNNHLHIALAGWQTAQTIEQTPPGFDPVNRMEASATSLYTISTWRQEAARSLDPGAFVGVNSSGTIAVAIGVQKD